MLKVQGLNFMQINLGYEDYFEVFVKKDKVDYKVKEEEGEVMGINEIFLYVIFFVFLILLVFVVVVQRGNMY